jgi:hypothetical protein
MFFLPFGTILKPWSDGTLAIHEEVLFELEAKQDELFKWAKARRGYFVSHDDMMQNMARTVLADFPRLVMSGRGRNQADAFVIALARVHGLAVVTEEHGGSHDKPRIPFICQYYSIPTLPPVNLIRAMGWRF